jgi:hypothetical protein
MTVPGILADGDMGDVAALVAPCRHFVALGAPNPLTPVVARDPALSRLRAALAGASAETALHIHVAPEVEQRETPPMRAQVIAFLPDTLGAPSAPQSHPSAPRGA